MRSPAKVIVTGLVILSGEAFASEVPFGARTILDSSPLAASSVAVGDLDGDGVNDVVGAGFDDTTVAWWRSLGDGSFTKYTIATPATDVTDVEVADINGDGLLDVVAVAADTTDAVAWYENDGTPMVGGWPFRLIAYPFDGGDEVAVADFNRDGYLDVAAVAADANLVSVALNNNGTGIGWSYETVDTGFVGATWVSAGDVDGDGNPDVIAAAEGSGEISWWSRSLTGTWTKHAVSTFASATVAELADLDQDGDLDILGGGGPYAVWWWENDGSGGGWDNTFVGNPAGDVTAVNVADIDLDGDPDVVFAAEHSGVGGGVVWFENTASDASDWRIRPVDSYFTHVVNIAAADLDDDGDPDLVAAGRDENEIGYWMNMSIHRSASFPESAVVTASADRVRDLTAADIDDDGDDDLLVADLFGSRVFWSENVDGDGGLWQDHTLKSGFPAMAAVAGDLDCDGDTDVVAVSEGNAVVSPAVLWWQSDGVGGWTELTVVDPSPHWDDVALGLADLDGDGDLDIVLGSYTDGLDWYENEACGTWIEHNLGAGHLWDADSMVLADIDGDGDTDVAIANMTKVEWFPNRLDETGFFDSAVEVAGGMDLVRSVAAGDLDGDGDIDLAAAEQGDDQVMWWPNEGGDGMTWGAGYLVVLNYSDPRIIRLADLDLDGDPDVAMAAEDRPTSASWFGWIESVYPAGTMWRSHPATTAILRPAVLAVADFDGDGDSDLVCDDFPATSLLFWPNRGGQTVVEGVSTAPPTLDPLVVDDVLQITVTHRGRSGDADAELASMALLLTDGASTPLTDAEADALLVGVYVYDDDDLSGNFDPAHDVLVGAAESFSLDVGVLTLTFPDGESHLQVAQSTPRVFFVAIAFEEEAAVQIPDRLEVVILAGDTVVEDSEHDIPLINEWASNTASGVVVPTYPFDLIFEDGFESGNTNEWSVTFE